MIIIKTYGELKWYHKTMMDAYSYQPGPDKEGAMREIQQYFASINGKSHLLSHGITYDMESVNRVVQDVIYIKHQSNTTFGSYTGWAVFFKKDLIKECVNEIIKKKESRNEEP